MRESWEFVRVRWHTKINCWFFKVEIVSECQRVGSSRRQTSRDEALAVTEVVCLESLH